MVSGGALISECTKPSLFSTLYGQSVQFLKLYITQYWSLMCIQYNSSKTQQQVASSTSSIPHGLFSMRNSFSFFMFGWQLYILWRSQDHKDIIEQTHKDGFLYGFCGNNTVWATQITLSLYLWIPLLTCLEQIFFSLSPKREKCLFATFYKIHKYGHSLMPVTFELGSLMATPSYRLALTPCSITTLRRNGGRGKPGSLTVLFLLHYSDKELILSKSYQHFGHFRSTHLYRCYVLFSCAVSFKWAHKGQMHAELKLAPYK